MRYMVSGYEEFPVLHLVPAEGDSGAELPTALYERWVRARTELDSVQRAVLAHLREAGGRSTIPEELWESVDREGQVGVPSTDWDSW